MKKAAIVLCCLIAAVGGAVWFVVGRPSPKSEPASRPATSSASAPSVVDLYFRDQASGKCTLRPVPVAELTPKRIMEIFEARSIVEIPTYENIFRILPYSVNYEYSDDEIIWPYGEIMKYILEITPIDGAAVYDDSGHLIITPSRKFATFSCYNHTGGPYTPLPMEDGVRYAYFSSLDLRPPDFEKFKTELEANRQEINKDIAYVMDWYHKRQGKLQFVSTYQRYYSWQWAVPPVIYTTTGPYYDMSQAGKKTQRVKRIHFSDILCDPSIDRCDADKWHKGIEMDPPPQNMKLTEEEKDPNYRVPGEPLF